MKKLISFGFTFLLLINLSCDNQNNINQQDLSSLSVIKYIEEDSFSEFLEKVRVYYKLPAIAASVVSHDSVLCIDAVGINNTSDNIEVDLSSKFNIGSCGKSLSSLLVAKFVDTGLINWDTRIIDYISFNEKSIISEYKKISIEELLSHSSGFAQYSSDQDFFNVTEEIPEISGSIINERKQFTNWNFQNLKTTRKGEFSYSNGGYVVAASILEHITHKSWEVLLNEEIIQPLGLKSAIIGFAQDYDKNQPWRHYHRNNDGYGVPLYSSDRKIPDLFNPAGNISMSIGDFAKYAQFQLKCLFEYDKTLLNPNLVKKLHKPKVNISQNESYGLGWGIKIMDGGKVSAHSGGDGSTYAIIAIDHISEKAWVILTNIGDSQAELACGNIIMETQKI